MVDNVEIAVGIATPSFIAVYTLFPLPVLLAAILNFGSLSSSINFDQRLPTLGSVLSVKSMSSVVENVAAAFGIASQ